MKNRNRKKKPETIVIQTGGLLSACIGLLAIIGWIFNQPLLASFESGKIPMALSTAMLFVFNGFTIFFFNRFSSKPYIHKFAIAAGSASTVVALLFLYLSASGIRSTVEHLGLEMSGTGKKIIAGHISPITAFCFVLVGVSYLMLAFSSRWKKGALAGFLSALVVILISIIFFLPYLFGTPLLYRENFIPPALPTALAFLFLGIALTFDAGLKVRSNERLSYALSIRTSYILALILVILITSITAAGYSYYKNYENQYRIKIEHELTAIAGLKVSEIVQWRKERMGDARVFYKNINFSIRVKQYLETPKSVEAHTKLLVWIRKVQEEYKYNRISLCDTGMAERMSYPVKTELTDSLVVRQISNALRSQQIVFQDFY